MPVWVLVEAVVEEGGCRDCGVGSGRIHARAVQVVKDVPCGGTALTVQVRKRRFPCEEDACARCTFVEETDELPFRARFTTRLAEVLDSDQQIALAWGVEEHVRQLLATRHVDDFHREWAHLEPAVRVSKLPEAQRLLRTLNPWRRELLTFCRTRITNARTEAANLNAKTFKPTGRENRNHNNHRTRIIAHAPTPMAA